MTPQAIVILETVKEVARAISAYFAWAMTDEGKKFTAKVMEDRAAWDKFWADSGVWFTKLFKGELFQ